MPREYHGMTRTPLWETLQNIKERCYNPNHPQYKDYGGRGIRICDEWRTSFSAFAEHLGQRPSRRHSIGRIDNDGPYSPENCRWETPAQQNRNRRSVILYERDGKSMCLKDWAAEIGIDYSTLHKRVAYSGMSFEDAITAPLAQGKRRHP